MLNHLSGSRAHKAGQAATRERQLSSSAKDMLRFIVTDLKESSLDQLA